MRFYFLRSWLRPVLCGSVALLMLFSLGCPNKPSGESSSPNGTSLTPNSYQQLVSAFFVALRSYEVGDKLGEFKAIALKQMEEAAKLAPKEPAIWINLALIQQGAMANSEGAIKALEQAQSLVPNNSDVQALYGYMLVRQGKIPEGVAKLKHALELDPKNMKACYQLADALTQNGLPDAPAQTKELLDKVLAKYPENLAALRLYGRNAAERKDATTLKAVVESIAKLKNSGWEKTITDRVDNLQKIANQPDVSSAVTEFEFLKNQLAKIHRFARDLKIFKVDIPLERFLTLPTPPATPSPEDAALTFTEEPLKEIESIPNEDLVHPRYPLKESKNTTKWNYVRPIVLKPEVTSDPAGKFKVPEIPEGPQGSIVANGSKVQIATGEGKVINLYFPGGAKANAPRSENVVPLDLNSDFRLDLVLAGEGGIHFYTQSFGTTFNDVSGNTKLPASLLNRAYYGAWACDEEMDGDLDLVVAPVQGEPTVLRNNGDYTWKEVKPFAGAKNVRGFLWADLDNDGDQDVVMLNDAGKLLFYTNERSGAFLPWSEPKVTGKTLALGVADLTRFGKFQVITLQEDGKILSLFRNEDETDWEVKEIAQWQNLKPDGTEHLLFADLDNNGAMDMLASNKTASSIWLGDPKGAMAPLKTSFKANSLQVGTVGIEGRLCPLGITSDGKAVRLVNRGTKNYHWQEFRPRADFAARAPISNAAQGSNRINSFGLGSSVEMRASLLYQKQLITDATLHFGLGENTNTDALRFVWTNGYVRAEFAKDFLKIDIGQYAPFRPGGSCPWLYAWNGMEMVLVTDCIWRSPLGLKINAQDTAGVAQTEDWIKLRGDQLQPRDGYYDLRICAELWETHFFDYLSLVAVDHPANTDIWIDERFSIPPPPLEIITTTKPHPVLQAVDDNGADVTRTVQKRDEEYLDTFGRGQYQGVTRDHWVEVALEEPTNPRTPQYLIATGWIHPTDSGINVALAQGSHEPPQGLRIEVPNGKGGWTVAKPGLGFPEGKIKTVVLNLAGIFRPNTPRRVRLRTNLEIYWDYIGTAQGVPSAPIRTQTTTLSNADLHYRGFSATKQKDGSSPEIGIYKVAAVKPIWLDLEGYYTRFGDVKPLLSKIDDHYVIMNAGDEMQLKFGALPPPPAGWSRDYVLKGDGWVKDGNFNTAYSKTVLPLPAHDLKNYNTPPGHLENDPVYKRSPQDWQLYHTRYVSPREFNEAMKPRVP